MCLPDRPLHRNHGKPCKAGCGSRLKTGQIRGGGEYCDKNKCRKAAEAAGDVKKHKIKHTGGTSDSENRPSQVACTDIFCRRDESFVVPAWNRELHAMALHSSWSDIIWQRMNFYEEVLAAECNVDLSDQHSMAELRAKMASKYKLVWPAPPALAS